jgi:protein TonB
MNKKVEKVPGFDEIIFENRNKEYGAYQLRRRYKTAASFSILGGVIFYVTLFIFLSVFTREQVTGKSDQSIIIVISPDNSIDPNKIVQPIPEKTVPVPALTRYIEPEVVEDSMASGNMMMITDLATDSVKNGTLIDNTDTLVFVPVMNDTEETEPFIAVEEPPFFPGGNTALLKFISDNTIYPAEAADNNIQGKVLVKFAVSADGSVKRVEIICSVHPLLDEEAARVVSSLPLWKPGKQNGKPVPVWFFVPVNFQLRNY